MTGSPKITQLFNDLVIAIRSEIVAELLGGIDQTQLPIEPPTKREPTHIDRLTSALLEAIQKSPGRRIDQLAAELDSTPKALVLPATRLLAAKQIKKRGVRRGTTYHPIR